MEGREVKEDAQCFTTTLLAGEDVRQALDNLLSGREPSVKVKPSIGCNIKWSPGNEPAYAQ